MTIGGDYMADKTYLNDVLSTHFKMELISRMKCLIRNSNDRPFLYRFRELKQRNKYYMYLNNPVVLLILVDWTTGNFSDKLLLNLHLNLDVNIIRFKT